MSEREKYPFSPVVAMVAMLIGCTSREVDADAGAVAADTPSRSAPAGDHAPVRNNSEPAAGSTSAADAAPAPAANPPPPKRVHALSRNVWIYPRPDATDQWIGFLWFGGSVPLRKTEPRSGPGCRRFYAISPRGYVCVDDRRATLDAHHSVLTKLIPYSPRVDSPWPHHYGESRGLQRYVELPSEKLQRQREPDLRNHRARIERARGGGDVHPLLEGVDLTPSPSVVVDLPKLPRGLREDRRRILAPSAVAYSAETFHAGRSWLLSGDLWWMPKDRVKFYPKVTFRGIHLNRDAKLPLAFFRGKDRHKYRRDGESMERTGDAFARLSWVELTGDSLTDQETVYLETRDGSYVRAQDAVVPQLREQTPWGAPVGEKDETGHAPRGRQTWLDVSVWGGWLVAYEGTRAVFTTLVSAGRGGTPQRGRDPLETAATPTGRFSITGKFKTATMVAPGDFIHSDVPWAQNFTGPYALHSAYWHNDWGKLKSGGCINVSPIDGKWLFDWTEPEAPGGWHGVRWLPKLEPSTTLLVRR